jgi:hypothetical protein
MKRAILACVLVAVAAFASGAWSSSTATTPTEKKLIKDVTTLQKQVKALQAAQKKEATNADAVALLAIVDLCGTVMTADALQGSWQIVDQLSAATQTGKTYFGPQTPLTLSLGGKDICQGLGVSRSQVVPPTVATYQALLGPLNGYRLKGLKLEIK